MSGAVRVLVDALEIERPADLSLEVGVGVDPDTFEVTIPNPEEKYTEGQYGLFDTRGKTAKVEICGALELAGIVDGADFLVLPEAAVTIRGRDWTGVLVDEIVPESLAARMEGRRSDSIVEMVAKEYKFGAEVDRGTKVFAGEQALPAGTSVWEVLRTCAEKDGYDVYCDAQRRIVYKKREVPNTVSVSYAGSRDAQGVRPSSLHFAQDKTMSLALKVRVVGYDEKAGKRIVYTAESKLRNRPNYKLIEIVDLTLRSAAEVRDRAQALLAAYSKGLVTGELVVPASQAAKRRQAIEIVGCKLENRYFVTGAKYEYGTSGVEATVAFANRVLAYGRDITVEKDVKEKTPKDRYD